MIVTLLTDFGTADYFVGAMKGALLAVNPRARIIDLTHDIPAHDIRTGAFTLLAASEPFPPKTIHVAVVDPGVGSARRPILVVGREHLFVGPDNGLFSYIYDREGGAATVYHLTNERYFRLAVSATFHGRDLFAPIAGALLNGVEPAALGEPVTDAVRLPPLAPQRLADSTLAATIIHIDRFGNCVTNISRRDLSDDITRHGLRLTVGDHEIRSFRRYFADASGGAGREAFAVWGSAGFLEIAVSCDSAARLLNLRPGQEIFLTLSN